MQCINDGAQSVADVKTQTKAGSGCGGCAHLLLLSCYATLSDVSVLQVFLL